jgi:uncharacterized protein YjbI with pentapeptide repeats
MANKNQLKMLKKNLDVWDTWRQENPSVKPDLREADLTKAHLVGANLNNANLSDTFLSKADLYKAELVKANLAYSDLSEADLNGADLSEANLHAATLTNATVRGANLSKANLTEAVLSGVNLCNSKLNEATLVEANLVNAALIIADLTKANLAEANLEGANLTRANFTEANLAKTNLSKALLKEANFVRANLGGANLSGADLNGANLSGANLKNADLSGAKMIGVKLNGATINGCRVFGVSAWGLVGLEKAEQANLIITPESEPIITVDNLEVAQFLYLLLHSERIRFMIDSITSKVVLILGRFTSERKAVLDAIRDELRTRDYLPVLFDFDKPSSRDITETVSTLAHMARFVIADITDAKSIPQELETIVPDLPSVPIQPILQASAKEYPMFEHFTRYNWVLKIHHYIDTDDLLNSLAKKIIIPAEKKAKELQQRIK